MTSRIIVKDQKQLDDLPEKFDDYTVIEIRASGLIVVGKARENSSVVARGNSSVEAWGNSSVVARENSSVVARGNSSVVAWENSSVEASDLSILRVCSSEVDLKVLRGQTVVTLDGVKCKIPKKPKTVSIISRKEIKQKPHNLKSFIEEFGLKKDGGQIVLFKSVHKITGCDFYSGKIKYEGLVECPDFDPNPMRECGGGLHLSPTKGHALSYNSGKILKCRVHVDDIVVYPHNIDKVRCRKVEVLGVA